MDHSFSIDVAKHVGVLPAIIFNQILFWIRHNESNGSHFYDGNFWTYNSNKAFQAQFEYMTEKQIRNAICKLKDSGFIVTGNYNKVAFDRTLWFALGEHGKKFDHKEKQSFLCAESSFPETANPSAPEGKSDMPQRANQICPRGQTYTSYKPVIRTDTKENITKETSCDEPLPWETPEEEVAAEPLPAPEVAECVSMDSPSSCFSFEEFWSAYGKRVERVKCERIYARIGEKDRLVIRERLPLYIQSTPDKAYRKNPQTYLNGKCWNDDIIEPRKNGRPVIDRTVKGF